MEFFLPGASDSDLMGLVFGERITIPLDALALQGPQLLRAQGAYHAARQVEALLELFRRWGRIPLPRGDPVPGPHVLVDRMRERFRGAHREEFIAVLLDGQSRVLRDVTVSLGTQESALVVPRNVLVEAIRESASGVLFVHNHPSGNPLPSPEDVQVTRRLREVCAWVGIRFVDHVIVAEKGYFSFQEEGM